MGALLFSFLAAGCAALSNLCFRKNSVSSQSDGNSSGYLLLFYLSSLIFSLVSYPEIWEVGINPTVMVIGGCVGALNVGLMSLTSRALTKGPAGLTFAFQNSSAVFPGVLLFLLFGSDFGFSCSYLQLIGMALVIFGLFLGSKNEHVNQSKMASKWLKYALACFLVQVIALTCIQGRCILFDCDKMNVFTPLTFTEAEDIWFMPGQFGVAFVLQALFFFKRKKKLQSSEAIYGLLGGVANFASTALLLLATRLALPFEKGVLLPCFAVATIIFCNLWANRLYQEKFNFKANALCACGIFIGILRL